jgi:electron transfer flavoprotein alpha subunit
VRAIVLVKQVPDLRLGGVGVHPDGTIDRGAAPPITNPADLHAVEAAVQLADDVVALSMGPAAAEAALRDAVAGGAARGVLLCDHLLAGSDTWATANALAAAIRHLGGADLVVCGLAALDGETGQVGPSVAQRLGWPQVTGCESVTVDGGAITARRIVEGGYEVVRATLPAVISVGETGFTPRYPSLPARRRAQTATIQTLDAATVGLGPEDVGLAASPTKVARMAPAPWPDRGCRFVADGFGYDELVAALEQRGALAPATEVGTPEADSLIDLPDDAAHDGPGAIWVVCHTVDGGLDRASRELLSAAVDLAPALGGGVGALVLTGSADSVVADAARHGADVVYLAADPALAPYRTDPWSRTVVEVIRAHRPDTVLFAATTSGRDLAPRVASELSTGLAADCTGLHVDSWTRQSVTHDRLLHMVRPAMAGGVLATCLCPEARPQMATVRPGVFGVRDVPRRARVVEVPFTEHPDDARVVVLERHTSAADVDLRDADVVIAGGAGCDAGSWHLVEELAKAIGGRVAGSRGAVEAGLAVRAQQVGQTGATVRPKLYVACGISGALQHAVGMQDSDTIVAINRDPEAVVFRLAHFGIVGDVSDALPALTDAFRRRR